MAQTSARTLHLLSLLDARAEWAGSELAARLGVSARTLRRDVDTLRELGYPVEAAKGPRGGYRLGVGGSLPPLVLDDDQAIAIAVALQTAPASVAGIEDSVARALTALRQVMVPRLRAASEALEVTTLKNYWEFAAPPIDAATLQAVGAAIRDRRVLRFDLGCPQGDPPGPREPDFAPPVETEPHHLVVWGGRWYLIARGRRDGAWKTYRVDRMILRSPVGAPFTPAPLCGDDLIRLVVTNPDRGDTADQWPCRGTATIELSASVVARWAPGGSVVEHLDDERCRLTIGSWSWAGVAGLFSTFDADLSELSPVELVSACGQVSARLHRALPTR